MEGKYRYDMEPEEKKSDRCSMSTACGFGLVLLAILIAAAVGIVVYFAAARPLKCECPLQKPNSSMMRFAELEIACQGLAKLADPKICNACPKMPPMTTVPPTMPPTTPEPTTQVTTVPPSLNMTLPGEVQPYHYNLDLDIEFSSAGNWLNGKVSIFLDVNVATKTITLNSRLLNITSQSLSSVESGDTPPDVTSTSMDPKRYFFVIELSKELIVGKRYRLDLQYNDRISSSPYGIYLSPYESPPGEAKYSYLTDAAYNTVENSDLWKALNEAAANAGMTVDMGSKMESWLTQLHYPVVMVTRVSQGIIEVEQHLYKKKGMDIDSSEAKYGYRWDIPILYATSSDQTIFNTFPQPSDFSWMSRTKTRIFLKDSKFPDTSVADSWVLVNAFQVGYFRVNYQESNWMALMKQLKMNHTVIPAINRAQIIDDAFALNRAGELRMSIALRTLNFLKMDTDYVPWTPAAKVIGQLESALMDTVMYGAYRAFMKDLVKEAYAKYRLTTVTGEPPFDAYQRARIAGLACHYGVQECLDDAAGAFKSWTENATSKMPVPDLLNVVACYGIQEGGLSAWQFVHNLYWTTEDYRFAQELVPSLACAKEQWLIKSILLMSSDTKKIKMFHQSLLIKSFLKTHAGREVTFGFIKDNAESLRTSVVLEALFAGAEATTSTAFPEEVDMVARKKPKIRESQVEDIKYKFEERKKMVAEKKEPVVQWLTENGYGSYFLQEQN